MSLYDIVSMIIPGGILLWILSKYCPCLCFLKDMLDDHEVIVSVFFICPAAYVLGLANHIVASKLWRVFRNNPLLLAKCLDDEINLFHTTHKLSTITIKKDSNLNTGRVNAFNDFIEYSFVVALGIVVLSAVIDIIFSLHFNGYVILALALLYTVLWAFSTMFVNGGADDESKKITDAYYVAYYYDQQTSKNSDISVMEGQVAFLQSMTIPLAILVASHATCICLPISQYIRFAIFVTYIGIFPLIYNRIKKIHCRVWEDYEFLSRLDNTEDQRITSKA